jgi:hypothetical protein
MKVQPLRTASKTGRQSGSVLVICLMLAVILGVTLGSYLLWVRSQSVLTTESHAWNTALAVAEAGVEEAMAHINTKFGTNNNLAANGWGGVAMTGPYGPIARTLKSSLGTNGDFRVMIAREAANGFPIIYSTGYTIVPVVGQRITRVVEAMTATSPAFAGAIAALDNITFKGNDIKVDSYDSMDPAYSTNGMYDPAKRKAGGDVASSYGFVDVGNANVNGKVRTGPNGSSGTGPNGFAGDLSWTGPGIQPGWYANDFNADFLDASLPDGFSGIAPIGAGTNIYVLGSFDYTINGKLSLKTGDNVLVTGNARLYVTDDIMMQGQATITILAGARLTIYGGGASSTFTSVNTAGNANSFNYFGLPTNKSLVWSGNAQYVGTVYAPQASFELGGGGNNTMDYQGACVVKAVTLNGKFNFHYDEALQRRGPMVGYRIRTWREI